MNKITIVRLITRLYFIGALVGSFIHLVHAAHRGGLTAEAYAVPFMVDGIAVLGIIMRSADFSKRTRKIGFRTQMIAGLLSLAGNCYAAHNAGGVVFGIAIVALFIFAEWLSDQIEAAAVDTQAEADKLAADAAAELASKKAASIAKAKATRAKNARTKKAEVKVLEGMLK